MPNGCLEWTQGGNSKGYGAMSFEGRPTLTHRVAWILVNGPIPDGLFVLHHCDNPPCCETAPSEAYPDGHLFLGTHNDNAADRDTKGRGANGNSIKTHCKYGHEFTEANTSVNKHGHRNCRTCHAANEVRRRTMSTTNEQVECDFCGAPVIVPVRDPVAVSWIGSGASTWCSTRCMTADAQARINAAGGV